MIRAGTVPQDGPCVTMASLFFCFVLFVFFFIFFFLFCLFSLLFSLCTGESSISVVLNNDTGQVSGHYSVSE